MGVYGRQNGEYCQECGGVLEGVGGVAGVMAAVALLPVYAVLLKVG